VAFECRDLKVLNTRKRTSRCDIDQLFRSKMSLAYTTRKGMDIVMIDVKTAREAIQN
jgi:hypothetical protein